MVPNNSLVLDHSIVWKPDTTWQSIRWRISDYYSWTIPTGIVVRNSDIVGGWAGENNFDWDPLLTMDGHLRKGSPSIDAGKPISNQGETDMDGEARNYGSQRDIGADEFIDSDADGLANHWEQKYFGSLDAPPEGDADGDGWTNLIEYERSSNPFSRIYYVDRSRPDDTGDGLTWDTAKRTIQAGINAAAEEDVVMVAYGAFSENLSLSKSVRVRSADPYLRSIIDFADTCNVTFYEKTTMNTTLEGFVLLNVRALPEDVILFNSNSRGHIVDCLFQDYARDAIHMNSAQAVISGCVFKGSGRAARGVNCFSSRCTLEGCRIEDQGYGAVYLSNGQMMVLDSLLTHSGTTAYPAGSIVDTDYNSGGSLTIRNSTVADNISSTNPTVRIPRNGQLVIENSILWNNGNTPVGGTPGTATVSVSFSDIQGGYAGTGNLNVNPGFIRNRMMNENGTPGTTLDDYWIEGDYHLAPGSLCRNAGNPSFVFPTGQADLDGRPRVLYGRVDIGAYEWMQGDTNRDSVVNYSELAEFAASWLKSDCGDCSGWDYTGDHQVAIDDLDIVLDDWLVMPEPYVPGLVAHWKLDQNALDSASWHHGTSGGNPQWVIDGDAKVGSGAVELDGDDWIQMAAFKGIGSNASRTCMAWVKTNQAEGDILGWGDITTAGGMWRMKVLDGKLVVQINGGSIQGNTAVNTGQWVHVAAVLPAGLKSTGDILLYVNGMQEGMTQKVLMDINTKLVEEVRIGGDINGLFFVGQIDDVRILNRTLPVNELRNTAGFFVADAGADRKITCPIGSTNISVPLEGKIVNGTGTQTVSWSVVSGPAGVVFEDASLLDTQAIFPILWEIYPTDDSVRGIAGVAR